MYLDEAGWMSMFNLLKCFYHNHPVKIDIAGTVESIARITDKLLYSCYNTFYNLHNMALAVVGNISVDDVLEVCDEYLKPCEELSIEKSFEDEPREIVQSYIEHNLELSVPVFAFGYKEACEKPIPTFRDYIEVNILLEVLAGKTSPLYIKLFENGLINSSFSKEYFTGYGYESIIFEGESEKPEEVANAIRKEVERVKNDGIDAELFESVRRTLYGKEIMSFNDIDNIANSFIACNFNDWNMFDAVNIYKDITAADIEKRLASIMNEEYSALSVVKRVEK